MLEWKEASAAVCARLLACVCLYAHIYTHRRRPREEAPTLLSSRTGQHLAISRYTRKTCCFCGLTSGECCAPQTLLFSAWPDREGRALSRGREGGRMQPSVRASALSALSPLPFLVLASGPPLSFVRSEWGGGRGL